MDNIFIFAGIISFIFFVVKFIEMRFIDKQNKPLKLLVRDTLLVYFSVILGNFFMDQMKPAITDYAPAVFVDNPTF